MHGERVHVGARPVWGAWSEQALGRAAERGPLAVNPIIYAELCLGFARESLLDEALDNALVEGHTLLTRDAQRYRTYFPKIRLIAPA